MINNNRQEQEQREEAKRKRLQPNECHNMLISSGAKAKIVYETKHT